MASSGDFLEAPQRLRALVRARESSLIVIAAVIGAMSGLFVAAMSAAVELLPVRLFDIPLGARLSGLNHVDPVRAIAVPASPKPSNAIVSGSRAMVMGTPGYVLDGVGSPSVVASRLSRE